ncbi:peroxisomal leader peptide-processing protease isoform X1 [Acyrthosiphon pisum]|uniref:Peroxisomal leader peptide-processing protease n=2 Tax=Acyrthosiphon pisum TaxID=7029 RepID=A0A8R2FBI1_ACYPI|nr:peroxisomal leader peptide-processing protease isoform X1 [Acyrthosiphon pisum]|eukprot:XP_008185200.1 PREDICTED: peroxisomal leader peptide-processing protease isoform X1 [Acyrthosiphon pisum]
MNELDNKMVSTKKNVCNEFKKKDGTGKDNQYLYLRSVAKIECGQNEGTAVCVHTSDAVKGHLFLTCAHVVDHTIQSVILRYDGHAIKGRVIYVNRKAVPYDIAVIVSEQTKQTTDILPCQISDKTPTIGQKMFSVGFACREYVPSTVFGHMHRMIYSILTTTCNVRAGFSGGPVFSIDRKLLGLTVGKLNMGTFHFVLPSIEFVETINKYIITNNIEILNDLESKCPLKTVLWNNGIPTFKVCHI